MQIISTVSLLVFFAGLGLALQACTLLTYPLATAAFGGAQRSFREHSYRKKSESRMLRRPSIYPLKKHGMGQS